MICPHIPVTAPTRTARRFGLFMRYSSLMYWCLLSVGLLAQNPASLMQRQGMLSDMYAALQPAVHFLGFVLLTFLVLSGSWRLSRRSMLLLIALYAAMTELLQGLIPSRTPEWGDFFQDLSGMAVGMACWWIAAWAARRLFPAAPAGSTVA